MNAHSSQALRLLHPQPCLSPLPKELSFSPQAMMPSLLQLASLLWAQVPNSLSTLSHEHRSSVFMRRVSLPAL